MNQISLDNEVKDRGACNYTRPIVTEAILAVLLGLTAKTALDQFFDEVPKLNSWRTAWNSFSSDPTYKTLLLVQLLVFLFTMYRFYLGSLRYHQAQKHYSKLRRLLFDMIANTILFVGFYLAALSIRSIEVFYSSIVVLHCLDFFWFCAAFFWVYKTEETSRKVMGWFLFFDVLTIVSFLQHGINLHCVASIAI